ncbi:MAG: hypothetical protein H0U77_05215 [Nocardioidaceae bacterium]|nr:hypothetical protein [Nocardioidaceae bacterium]
MNRLAVSAFRFALTGTVAALVVTAAPAAAGAPAGDDRLGARPTVQHQGQTLPAPNPWLSLLPDPEVVDWKYWRDHAEQQSRRAAGDRARLEEPLSYDELEPDGLLGANDTPRSAEPIDGFGTGGREEAGVSIFGTLVREGIRTRRLRQPAEDNGSIPKAAATAIPRRTLGVRTEGRIGDGPHGKAGTGNGDFDFFKVRVPAGRDLVTRMKRTADDNRLWPQITYWDEDGRRVGSRHSHDDKVQLTRSLAAGTYYVMTSSGHTRLRDPFASGSGNGAKRQGGYRLNISVVRPDSDFFAVHLDEGDELGGTVDNVERLSVHNPSGKLVFGSGFDASFIFPDVTPMPGGGRAVVDHTAAVDGRYTVEVSKGTGDYQADLEVYEIGGKATSSQGTQTLFLDFDGERINTGIWGGGGVSELSPLSAFLGRWGLARSDEDALIDRVVEVVTESVEDDMEARGKNENFDVRILNSRDHADPFGDPNVSRLIVGGTIRESGISTIGIAQTIDPGNFDREESALLLLDILSAPKQSAYDEFSANYWMNRSSDRVAWVGQVLGNITAHEAGHILGNWHVDQFDGRPNIMDQGGNARALFGPGPDNVGGTADDADIDFGKNQLNPFEGFDGTEDTLNRTAFGLTGLLARLFG